MPPQQNQSHMFLIDYYEGAYGPTIHIEARTIGQVTYMRDLLLEIAHGSLAQIELLDLSSIKPDQIESIILKACGSGKGKSFVRTYSSERQLRFEWCETPEGWRYCAGLLDGIVAFGRPSHQYLTDPSADALIEFSFRESQDYPTQTY